jgi:hypothetical protein
VGHAAVSLSNLGLRTVGCQRGISRIVSKSERTQKASGERECYSAIFHYGYSSLGGRLK